MIDLYSLRSLNRWNESRGTTVTSFTLACSRLLVVGGERKTRASEKKKQVGAGGETSPSSPLVFFLARPRFSLSPNYQESGTGYLYLKYKT